jgi:hypothetical protein
MNIQTSVAMPEITPRVDIEKIYRQLTRLRKMVKRAEGFVRKPARSSSRINPQRRHQA